VAGLPTSHPSRRTKYAELHAHSSHSLLDGVPSPEALAARAADLEIPALALTDHDALYGAVRFVKAAQEVGIKPILGSEMTLRGSAREDRLGSHLTLLIEHAAGYANLCRLITLARRDQDKGVARLDKRDLAAHAEGLIALSGCRRGEIPRLLMEEKRGQALAVARGFARVFGPDRFFIELQRHYVRGDNRLLARLTTLAHRAGLDVVATGNVHYLHPHQREVHDVLRCIRHQAVLEDAGDLLRPNDEYVLRSPGEMAALFSDIPIALENAWRIAERCASACDYLPAGMQTLPSAPTSPPLGGTRGEARDAPHHKLRQLCQRALHRRYPVDPPVDLLERELSVIEQMGLANYFLVVWDIVRFAQRAGIRCQGRGSAANSLVAYLLDISPIDPVACDLVFERFLSRERGSPPDIDIDIAADRREEVIQYVYERYGREHAAMACTFVTFRARSAVRDVARVLGFPPTLVERLAGSLDVRDAKSVRESQGMLEAFDAEQLAGRPFQQLLRLVPQLDGIPRHLGIHNGGMVLSGPPLCELVPLEPATMEDRVVTQWDKDSLEGLGASSTPGMVKIDLLGLRMLSAIEDAVTIVAGQTEQRPDLTSLSQDDPEVYDMLCRGETIGVFQVESRAQANLIPRFQPRSFDDLVIQISLIRPGPLQAQMVRPYLRRRGGREPVSYPHPLLEDALQETLGVIVFQEQVLKVARDLAGFTAGEAELLRRALSHKRAGQRIASFRKRFLDGARERGVETQAAERVFEQLRAFGGYSFPKSHAAAFAVLTYQSAWLRRYHPSAFFAALLRHQPMGFYPAHVVVSEARRCGVEVRPVDVEASDPQTTVEGQALRLGLAVVDRLGEMGSRSVVQARRFGPFRSLADFCRRTKLGRRAVEALIWAGAFDRWDVPRRELLWELQMALEAAAGPTELLIPYVSIGKGSEATPSPEGRPRFAFLSPRGRLWTEMAHTGVSAQEHPTSLVSDKLEAMDATPSEELPELEDGCQVRVGGMIVSRQHPPTAKGIAFLALEDEGGLINVVVHPRVYEESRAALRSPFVLVRGQLQRHHEAINVVAQEITALPVD
jgi:error-prone DNA polymerase